MFFYRKILFSLLLTLQRLPQPHLTVLPKECNPITINLPISFCTQFLPVFFLIHLLQRCLSVSFQCINMGGHLNLYHKRPPTQGGTLYHNIRTPVVRLPVGLYYIILTLAQEPGKIAMTKILCAVIKADHGKQLFIQNIPYLLCIPLLQRVIQIPEILFVKSFCFADFKVRFLTGYFPD